MRGKNKNLRIAILKKFDSQGDFAEFIGVHESAVSQVIRGRRNLKSETRDRWAAVLGCDPGDIF